MTPGVSRNTVYIVDQEGKFRIFDLSSGAEKAVIPTGAVQPIATEVTVAGNAAYFIGRNGTVVCIDLSGNRVKWEQRLDPNQPVMVMQDLEAGPEGVFCFAAGKIYGLSARNGNLLFQPVSGASGAPLYLDGYLVYGTADSTLDIIRARDGAPFVSKNLGEEVVSTKPAAGPNALYLGTAGGKIIIVNREGLLNR
jgi:outer membrane protein assembly factor BamB